MTDVFIIGKGPAGISASLYTVRAGLDTVVCGKDGGSLEKADRIDNYYGFAEGISAADLFEGGIKGAERLGVKVIDEEVFEVSYSDHFTITTNKGVHEAKAVVLAAGSSRKAPRITGLKEYEGRGVSYCAVCDAFFYRGAKVAVIGNGKYAMSEVKHLLPLVEEVTLLTNGRDLDCSIDLDLTCYGSPITQDSSYESFYAESVNDFEPDVFAKSKDGGRFRIITGKLAAITGDMMVDGVDFADGSHIDASGVFIAEGTVSSTDLARKLGVVDMEGKINVEEDMSTFVPGFFCAGDCNGGMLQVAKAVYEGALAGTAAVKFVRNK